MVSINKLQTPNFQFLAPLKNTSPPTPQTPQYSHCSSHFLHLTPNPSNTSILTLFLTLSSPHPQPLS